MKPGWKTTEFWLTMAAMLVGAVMASGILEAIEGDIDNKLVGMIAMVLSGLGYSVNRMWVKGSDSKAAALAAISKDPQ